MANWLCTRDAVKRSAGIKTIERDSVIDSFIEQASREIEDELCHRRFIPLTATRSYSWPQRNGRGSVLYLDEDLLSVSALTKEGDDVTAIAAADYFLEPSALGPPYSRIEIDLASSSFFSSKSTHQRQIRVTGDWGYGNATKTAGTVASGLASDAAATTFVGSDGSLIGVGDTLLIATEQLFVSERTSAALGSILVNDATITADMADVSITVDGSHGIVAGEVILIDSERMYVSSVATNVLTVIRAFDGSVLAAHADDTAVHVFRTLTVVRGVNGTTAAVHPNASAISKYAPPADIANLCKALAIAYYEAERGAWTGAIGTGESTIETRHKTLNDLRARIRKAYGRRQVGAA